jgi:hypothetical protein
MNTFREKHPDAKLDDRISIHEFVNQNEVSGIIFDILQLRSAIVSSICENFIAEGYFKELSQLSVINAPENKKILINLDKSVINLFDTVLPPLLPNRPLTQCLLDLANNDPAIVRKKLRLEGMFATALIQDTELTHLFHNIAKMSLELSSEFTGELTQLKVKKINQEIYENLIKIRSELTTL